VSIIKAHGVLIAKTNQLIIFREKIAVNCENNRKHIVHTYVHT